MSLLRKNGQSDLSEETENSWKMDPDLTEYANEYRDIFILNQTLSNNILSQNSVPACVKRAKSLDTYLKQLLQKQDQRICLSQDKSLANVQERNSIVYDPLWCIWLVIQEEEEACPLSPPPPLEKISGDHSLPEISNLFNQQFYCQIKL